MPSFEAIRERLPSLYRPEDDDLADPRLPLVAGDIRELLGDPEAEARLVTQDRRVRVELPPGLHVEGVKLRASAVVAPTTVVAAFLPDGLRPHAIARVVDGVAHFNAALDRPLFTLELRRRGLLSSFLLGIGDTLDDADRDAALVLHAHWEGFADRALYSPFYLRTRQLEDLGPPDLHDPDLLRFPYISDLARLAALLPVAPWVADGEVVEAYRLRIERMVALYKDGVGTLEALLRMVEIELPVALSGPPEERDRGLVLEEFAPSRRDALDVTVPGNPPGTVAPLMHWTVEAAGLAPVPATAYVTGVAPGAERPVLELYEAGLALGYRGTVADGQVLRLRPAFSSWLARPAGVDRALALPTDGAGADPAAPGPWSASPGAPGGVVALAQTRDRILWAATADGKLARYDGKTWSTILTALGVPHCLAATPDALLVGTDAGLLHVPLFPDDGFVAHGIVGVTGPVYAISVDAGGWTLGTKSGIVRRGNDSQVTPVALAGVAVRAIAEDAMGAALYGTDRGVIQHQPGRDHWYAYHGGGASDTDDDWVRIDPAAPLAEVFLPPVRALHRGADGALWLGTDHGLARYVARPAERLAFTTALEAFPDLGTGAIHVIARDAHGVVWIGGADGLFRADRRDLWHVEDGDWRQLGRADTLYDGPDPLPRGSWRFDRAGGAWQRFDAVRGWVAHTADPRIEAEDAVTALAWSDEVAADVDTAPVAATDLVMRFKPADDRIVDGGVPALPRIAPGRAVWRYLQLEGDDEPARTSRPSWTREGRLLEGPSVPPELDDPPEPDRFEITRWTRGLVAFPTAAKVRMEWQPTQRLSVAARLRPRSAEEAIEPAVLDRVFDGISQVRPAGVRAVLAVDETIVRGEDVGAVA
jgi:hypothetical protein